MDYIDLHIHSIHSDGTLKPAEIVEYARQFQLKAISLTDHDSIDGVEEAILAGKRVGVEVIPGIEISSNYFDRDIHILGYCLDIHHPAISEYTRQIRVYREERAKRIIELLKQSGIHITWQLVKAKSAGGVIGRPHIADVLLEEGYVYSFRDAFDKYLGESGKAFVPKEMITPLQAIDIIHQAGGLACIAHPGVDIPDDTVLELLNYGLDGIEVYHPKHSKTDIEHYLDMARKHQLFVTGGSDSHGLRMLDITIGSLHVPYKCIIDLKNKCNNLHAVRE